MSRVLFFASDRAEIAQIRRIRAVRRAGHDVQSVSMVKSDGQLRGDVDWKDIDLGTITNGRLAMRMRRSVAGLYRIWRHRAALRKTDVIIARNIDMVLLALSAKALCRIPAPVIYECLDIHGMFIGDDIKAKLARRVERWVLARTDLLAVSSDGFVDGYFSPIQNYTGPTQLIENKLTFDGPPPPRASAHPVPDRPLTIGWVGTIRCEPTLRLLSQTARQLEGHVQIAIHGIIHHHALADFDATLAEHPNMTYHGPYPYPDGLAQVYAGCDLVWAQDLWQSGSNSDWLLPNRIYEASWFGCPSVALATTMTGRTIAQRGLGFTIPEPTVDALKTLIAGLGPQDLTSARERLARVPDDALCQTSADIDRLFAALEAPKSLTKLASPA
ncbi:glycosyltransferase [Celeribacter arenosi]|uniref:Glycosyl transferase family 1 n=1 Tax=Celeribacter arenosi TaxID=792649 RepID=A0ABP7JST9_9RHOB